MPPHVVARVSVSPLSAHVAFPSETALPDAVREAATPPVPPVVIDRIVLVLTMVSALPVYGKVCSSWRDAFWLARPLHALSASTANAVAPTAAIVQAWWLCECTGNLRVGPVRDF